MLDERNVPYRYREYREERLDAGEIRALLDMLDASARDVLRRKDKAFAASGLTGDEPDERLIEAMAAHPTLLQRPIGVRGSRAVVGRPPENLLRLADD